MSISPETFNLDAPEIAPLIHQPTGVVAVNHLLEVTPVGEAPAPAQLHTNETGPADVIATPHGIVESPRAAGTIHESAFLFHESAKSLDVARVLNGKWRAEGIQESREAVGSVLAFMTAAQEGKTTYVPTLEEKVTALEHAEHAYQHTVGAPRLSEKADTPLGPVYTAREIDEPEISAAIKEGDDAITASLFEATSSGRTLGLSPEQASERVASDGQAALELLTQTTNPTDKQVGAIRIWKWAMKHRQFDIAAQSVDYVSDPEVSMLLGAELEEAQALSETGKSVSEKIVDDLEVSSRKQLDAVLARENRSIEEAGGTPISIEQLEQQAVALEDKAEIHTRIGSPELIEMIMRNGRQRSVLETGVSGSDQGRLETYDSNHNKIRRQHEDTVWSNGRHGLGDVSYAALELPSDHDGPLKFQDSYGAADVVLKTDRVKGRTTFTYGDSATGPKSEWATHESLMNWDDAVKAGIVLDRTAEAGVQSQGYVEAQVVDGIEIDDIESVTMPLADLEKAAAGSLADGENNQESTVHNLPGAITQICERLQGVPVTLTVNRDNLRLWFDGASSVQSTLDQNPGLKIVVIDSQENVEALEAKKVHSRLITQGPAK